MKKKGLKQRLAVALIVAMTAGMTAVPAWADENPVRQWVNDGGKWYFYNGDGELTRGKEKYIRDNWYGFDDDGVMYSNELFVSRDQRMDNIMDVEDGEELEPNRLYAFSAGNLAKAWVKLREEGELYTEADSGEEPYWYYFEGGSEEKAPKMLRGASKEHKIEKSIYRFDNNGKMYQREWFYEHQGGVDADGTSIEDDFGIYYYQSDGPKAVKKWLPIDGYWYRFDTNGEVHDVAGMASPSDAQGDPVVAPWMYNYKLREKAPARQVHSVTIASGSNADVDVVLGETVTLEFKVTLASDSNAEIQNFDDFDDFHDFEPGSHVTGRFYVNKAETDENGICHVDYTPKKVGEEKVKLCIDGIVSDLGIMVNTEIPVEADIKTKNAAVENVISSVFEDGAATEEARGTILEILDAGSDSDKKEIQKAIAENSQYDMLDSNYAMENFVVVKPANVAEEAQTLLGGGEISLVGGALNADPESEVELKVAPSAKVPVLKQELDNQTFKNKVSFDIKLAINGDDNHSELSFPVKITMPVPDGFDAKSMKLFHIHGDDETPVTFNDNHNGTITFTVTGFSDFVFAQNDTDDDNNGHGGSGGGGGGSSSSGGGVVTSDIRKGKVNSLTGIIIGSGDGYSKWVQDALQGQESLGRWKLQYADGTYATGGYVLDEQGNPRRDGAGNLIEQPAWELIGGAWYAFGADGYAKSGMVFDPAQNGWFYIDINTGMKTGWQQIDGKWYYFNSSSDGSKGIMYVNRNTPDGYTVGADGVWIQ